MPEKPTHLRLVRSAAHTRAGPTDRPTGSADQAPEPDPEPGPLMLDDDEQSRIPARRGDAGSTGCGVRAIIAAALIFMALLLGASLLLAADGLTRYEAQLAQEART